jgi:hypothetical protein
MMVLAFDFDSDQVQVHGLKLADLVQRLRRLARDARNLSTSQPDFLEKLEGLQNELESLACQLRGIN